MKNFLKRGNFIYHVCFETTETLEEQIREMESSGNRLISEPKEAVLFDNRRVCFLMTDVGLVELLEKGGRNDPVCGKI